MSGERITNKISKYKPKRRRSICGSGERWIVRRSWKRLRG